MAYKQSKNPFGKSPLNFSSPLNSFDSLVGKLMNQGKSKEAATKIAGKVANAKMKGAGSGPTAAQKARAKGSAAKMEESPLDKELIGNQHRLPEELKAKIEAAPESPAKLAKKDTTPPKGYIRTKDGKLIKVPPKRGDRKVKPKGEDSPAKMKSPMKKHSDAHIKKEAKRIARKNKGDEQDIYYELKSKYAQEKKSAAKKAKDAAKGSPAKNKANGKEHAQMGRKEKFNHFMVEHPAKNPKRKKEESKATKVIKDRKKTADLLNAKNPPSAKTRLERSGVKAKSPANISAKAAERKVRKGKGRIEGKVGGKDPDFRYVSNRRQKRADKAREDGTLKGIMKASKIKDKARKVKSSPANKKKSPLNNAYENPEYFVPTKSSYGQDMDNFFNTVNNAYANTQTDENRLERANRIKSKFEEKGADGQMKMKKGLSDRQQKRYNKFASESKGLEDKIGRAGFDIDSMTDDQINALVTRIKNRPPQ